MYKYKNTEPSGDFYGKGSKVKFQVAVWNMDAVVVPYMGIWGPTHID